MDDKEYTAFDRFIHDCEWEVEHMERVCRKNGDKLLAMVKDQVKTIDDLNAQLKRATEWIPITNPPTDDRYILLLYPDDQITKGYLCYASKSLYIPDDKTRSNKQPISWMELPATDSE